MTFEPMGPLAEVQLGGGVKAVAAGVNVRLPNGTTHGLVTNAHVPDHLTLSTRVTQGANCTVLELVDADGEVRGYSSVAHGIPEPEPWPRTQTIPSGVWTTLEDASAEVFHDTGADATVTVDAEGDITFGVPMKVRITPEVDYGSWGDDE